MLLNVLLLFPLFLAFPDLSVDRQTVKADSFVVNVQGDDELLPDCLKSGLEASYRFEVKLCHPRLFWMPSCFDERVETHTVSWDPITESYRYAWDRLGDELGQTATTMTDLDKVVKDMRTSMPMSMEYLTRGRKFRSIHPKAYLDVRFLSECRGEYNRTLSKISYYLTLGLVKVSGTDSGWNRFALAPAPESK